MKFIKLKITIPKKSQGFKKIYPFNWFNGWSFKRLIIGTRYSVSVLGVAIQPAWSWWWRSSFWSASLELQNQIFSSWGQAWEKSGSSHQMPWQHPPSPSESSQEYQSADKSQVLCSYSLLLSSGTTWTLEFLEMSGFLLGMSCWQ